MRRSTVRDRTEPDPDARRFRVAWEWLDAMAGGDLDTAVGLYRPGAVVRLPGTTAHDPDSIRDALGHLPGSVGGRVGVVLDDDLVRIDLRDGRPFTVHLDITDGSIAQQWVDVEPGSEFVRPFRHEEVAR